MTDEKDRPGQRPRGRRRPPADLGAPLGDIPPEGLPFGRYRLLKRISYGGMGEIFLAKHDGIGGFSKLLVIKRLLQHYREDKDVVRMFFDEAKLQALMSDRHIVQIWDMGKVSDQYFIAMEYVEGTSWRRLLERVRQRGLVMHPAHAVDLGVQACRGLSYAHNLTDSTGQPLSLVHRDVNPQNVLVSWAGECKIIDFGIAKSEMSDVHTETGTIKGKFAYMSPEQARAEPLDRRSDIFSMGICLYEMLAGQNPFHRKNVVLSLEAICEHAPPPLERARPDAAALSPLVERCLAKDPDDRFADCGELETALVSLYADGLCGEAPESLESFVQDLFKGDIGEQASFLRQHGFSSMTGKRPSGHSEPGTPSPFGVGADVTKRGSGRRSSERSSRSLEAPIITASSRRSTRRTPPRPTGEGPDTHPTATLALASLPSKTGERSLAATSERTPVPPWPTSEFMEDTELPVEGAPKARSAARLPLVVTAVLLLSLAGGLAWVAAADAATLDAVLAMIAPPEDPVAAGEPPLTTTRDAGAPARAAVAEVSDEEPMVLDAGSHGREAHDEQAARDSGPLQMALATVEPGAQDAGVAAEALVPDEPVATVDDERRGRRRVSKRRPSRDKRSASTTTALTEPAEAPVASETPQAPSFVLTVNAGGPFTIESQGVRGRNVAKVPLVSGGGKSVSIRGGPLVVKLRVVATASGADVRVETDPWTIVRANNLGRGRTPQRVRVAAGQPMQLVLKHPDAGEMKVTLGFSSNDAR